MKNGVSSVHSHAPHYLIKLGVKTSERLSVGSKIIVGDRLQLFLIVVLTFAITFARGASLTHRFSFSAEATDSVGGAHGTALNGVTFQNGSADFPGAVASSPDSAYIELPPGLISNYTSVTFEFWANTRLNGTWGEIYAFGNQVNGAGANMLMFTPHSGAGDFRMSYAQADPGYTDEYLCHRSGSAG